MTPSNLTSFLYNVYRILTSVVIGVDPASRRYLIWFGFEFCIRNHFITVLSIWVLGTLPVAHLAIRSPGWMDTWVEYPCTCAPLMSIDSPWHQLIAVAVASSRHHWHITNIFIHHLCLHLHSSAVLEGCHSSVVQTDFGYSTQNLRNRSVSPEIFVY